MTPYLERLEGEGRSAVGSASALFLRVFGPAMVSAGMALGEQRDDVGEDIEEERVGGEEPR